MELGLNKLPWKVQVGVFLAVAVAALGGFYWYYVQGAQDDDRRRSRRSSTGCCAEISEGQRHGAAAPGISVSRWRSSSARLDNLRAVLPEEKDVGDLLRRLQTLATQSNLTIRGFKPAPIVQKQTHAEWPIELELDGTYHNLGLFFDRVSKFPRIINVSDRAHQGEGQAAAGIDDRGAVRGDDLRAGGGAERRRASAARRPSRPRRRPRRRADDEITGSSCLRRAGRDRGRRSPRRRRQRRPPAAPQAPAQAQAPAPLLPADYVHVQPRGPARSVRVAADARAASVTCRGTARTSKAGRPASAIDEISRCAASSQSPAGLVAMVQGPDQKTYLVRQNDKLLDGVDEGGHRAGAGDPAGSQRSAVAGQAEGSAQDAARQRGREVGPMRRYGIVLGAGGGRRDGGRRPAGSPRRPGRG